MNEQTQLKKDVHRVLGVPIPGDEWEKTFEQLSTEGRIDFKTILRLFILLARHIEALEEPKKP